MAQYRHGLHKANVCYRKYEKINAAKAKIRAALKALEPTAEEKLAAALKKLAEAGRALRGEDTE